MRIVPQAAKRLLEFPETLMLVRQPRPTTHDKGTDDAMTTIELNTEGVLTEEMLDRTRAELGVERPVTKQWHCEATLDTIRHWAYGVGDDNPLWADPDYALTTKYGTNIAPPSFLYSTDQGPAHMKDEPSRGAGLPGIHAIWMGDRFRWHRPILRNTEIRVTKTLDSVEVRENSRFAGITADLSTLYRYYDGDNQLLAERWASFMHFGRQKAASQNKHADLERQVWTPDMLKKLNDDLDTECRRGGQDLVWNDVTVGDSIGLVVKGPLTATEMISFVQGWGGPFLLASELLHRYLRNHPKANVPDRYMCVPDTPERVHWDQSFAKECGFPDGYDFGSQRIAWMLNAVTNWAGDSAFVKSLDARLTALNIIGDATWCSGSVSGKSIADNGDREIELKLTAVNQRGTTTALATVVVVAPG